MKLTSGLRAKLPKTNFGLPERRSYPMPDRFHAVNAKARASQQLGKGNLSRAQYAAIVSKANSKLRSRI